MAAQDVSRIPGFVRTPADTQNRALTTVQSLTIAATGDDTGGTAGVIEEIVAPGGGPPLHIHHAADELFYVLSGAFTFKIGDLQTSGGAGTVAFAPRGTAHTWQNSGNEPARMLFVFTPAGFERFLVELSAVPVESLTMESVKRVAAPYQTTYVGPPLAAMSEEQRI